MKQIIWIITVAITVCAGTAVAQKNPTYSSGIETKIKEVETHLTRQLHVKDSNNYFNLQQRMKEDGINAVSIAVISNYQLEWARAYGLADVASNRPAHTQTLFQAASISKSLNGIGLLRMAQLGKIKLDVDINQYLKSWQFPYDSLSKGKKITIANLLTHTAGTSVHGFRGYEITDTLPSVIQILKGEKPANNEPVRSQRQPGMQSVYSGGGTTITQLIVTDIMKQRYDQYMWQYVLKPMGMIQSSYTQPPGKMKALLLSSGYRGNGEVVKGNYHIYPEQAAAGLWTNPSELAMFITDIQLSLKGKSNKVLDSAYARKFIQPAIAPGVGLGTFIEDKKDYKYFNHGGANEGFRCIYYGSTDGGNGVVVMVNSDNGRILDEIVNSVSVVYKWGNFFKPRERTTVPVSAELLKTYEGNYVLEGDTVTIKTSGKPMLIVNNEEFYPIYFFKEDEFFSTYLPFDLKFEKDSEGKISNIYFKNSRGEMRAKRVD